MSDIPALLLLAATVGGFIRGYAGFGGPMVILPVLNAFYPPALSIWIMALVDLVPNAYLIPTARQHATPRIWLPLTLGSLLTLAVGVQALIYLDVLTMRRVICIAIILACGLLMTGWLFRGQLRTGSWLAVGAASGLVLGACMVAVVTSVFLNAASRDTEQNRANFIMWAFATSVALVILLWSHEGISLSGQHAVLVAMAAAYFAGCVGGTLLMRRFKATWARPLTLALIILVAGSSLLATYNVFG